jgi:metallophosphoesterase superfamily enzyme
MRVHSDWFLTPQRAAVHLPTATAVLADMHLGYDEVRRRHGEAIPHFDQGDLLTALQTMVGQHKVRRLVIAGDLFEDGRASHGDAEWLWDWLQERGVDLTAVIPGNHDRGLPCPLRAGSRDLPLRAHGVELGGWRVLHGDGRLPRGRVIQGHIHPALRMAGGVTRPAPSAPRFAGGTFLSPCYLVGPRRIVLPAFSADATGVNVLGDRRWRSFRCYVPAGNLVLDFGPVARLPN